MDPAVGLVQAYLRVNGFFTVTEYPIVARTRGGSVTLTDVDVLAVRFPGAGRRVPDVLRGGATLASDAKLVTDSEGMDMIIGEVKEGRAKVNKSAYSLPVVETVIRRFGCCARDPAAIARAVIRGKTANTHIGMGMPCKIRLIVFGGSSTEPHGRYEVILLRHVFEFLRAHLDKYKDVFAHTQLKDETLDLIALMVKLGVKV